MTRKGRMKRMKKKLSLLLAVLFMAAVAITGCGGGDERLSMGTGGTGGTYYPLGGGMAEVWNNNIDGIDVNIQSTGASVENIRLLASGEIQLAMAMNNAATAAYNDGTDFRALGVIYPEVMQIIAHPDSGIKTIEDLVGKRVSIGPAGSGTAASAITILEAYGIDAENDFDMFQDNFTDAANKITDGQLDAAFAVLAVPAGNVENIVASIGSVEIVNITGDGLDNLIAADPTFSPYEIPAGTYDLAEARYTVSNWAVLYAATDMDEDLAYNLTRIMYENASDIARHHARGDQISLENATLGIAPVPFHPGAERFYQEQGLLD